MSNKILPAEDYLALPREKESWLLRHLIPVGGTMILYGDPKVGKSYAAIQLALALAGASSEWLGFPVVQTGPVVYVQLDTPRSLWAERLEALRDEGLPVEKLHLADRETLDAWPFDILHSDHEYLLRSALAGLNPKAVIIDTLKESNTADENSNTEMTNAINKLIAATQPAALILVAHSRKPTEHGPDLQSDSRGAGAIIGKMDSICRLSKKGLYYVGRAIEEGSVKLIRSDNGLWEPDSTEELDALIESILLDPTLTTRRAQARALATKIGKSEEAARSLLRRWLK